MPTLLPPSPLPTAQSGEPLGNATVLLVGPFTDLSSSEAEELVVERGGQVVNSLNQATLVVVGAAVDTPRIDALKQEAVGLAVEFLTEPLFLQQLIDADHGAPLRGLHSLTALADLVDTPTAAIRRWWLRGYLQQTRSLGRAPLFDWSEVQVAKRLARLLAEGRSLTQIDLLVGDLETQLPDADRPLASHAIDSRGGRLLIRDNDRLTEPSGQVVIDFESTTPEPSNHASAPQAVPLPSCGLNTTEMLRDEAWRLADRGEHQQAIEVCRAVLLSGDAEADDHFLLANLLYETGDLAAARERYYTTIEFDPHLIEARVNLGCVLAEQDDVEVALALLRSAVDAAPEIADARFHLARLLDLSGSEEEAVLHWRCFLELSPTGPWSDEARERLATAP